MVLEGEDYNRRAALLETLEEQSLAAGQSGGTVAAGLAEYDPQRDDTVAPVFSRADERMYLRKKQMKGSVR